MKLLSVKGTMPCTLGNHSERSTWMVEGSLINDHLCLFCLGGDKDHKIWKGLWWKSEMRVSPYLSSVSVKNTFPSDTELPFQRGRNLPVFSLCPPAFSSSNLRRISFLQLDKCFGDICLSQWRLTGSDSQLVSSSIAPLSLKKWHQFRFILLYFSWGLVSVMDWCSLNGVFMTLLFSAPVEIH